MAKKCLMAAVLASVLATGMWAQTGEPWGGDKNFVSVELGVITAGARYERLITPKLSAGVNFYWANSFIIFNELEAGLFARYYIWRGLFGELGLGFHTHTGTKDVDYGLYTAKTAVTTTGFGISPGLGWKFDPGRDGGFFVEPGVIIPITIGKDQEFVGVESKSVGVGVGFVLFCGLGWAL
jgi:hypothetical protein